jgi:phenylpropionate dioxygenase-like ring-hydroxylating dioxygenase large terminal subunit
MEEILICPICKTPLSEASAMSRGGLSSINCPNCGTYTLADAYHKDYIARQRLDASQLATLSYAIRRMQFAADKPFIVETEAENILRTTSLPNANEQVNNLILFMGQELAEPGAQIDLSANDMRAQLGCITPGASAWVISQTENGKLIQGASVPVRSTSDFVLMGATLTIDGWERFQELQKNVSDSKKAFMAMQFGDPVMDKVFSECLKPATKRAGYDLVKLDDKPRAGLIDDRLRLEIRTARFLIADLTHRNPGAYWEAGFAEGLGRPVIYTCKQSVFIDQKTKPHFDTNHYLSIQWNESDLSKAAEQLTTTIRITLPTEAKLTDD